MFWKHSGQALQLKIMVLGAVATQLQMTCLLRCPGNMSFEPACCECLAALLHCLANTHARNAETSTC